MNWIKRILGIKEKTAATLLAEEWERDSSALSARLERDQERLDAMLSRVQKLADRVGRDLREADRLAQVHSTAMEAIRNENRILAETIIPSLVAGHELVLQRVQADTAIQVRKQVALQPVREED
jgi:hypothetical protein